MEVVPDDPVGLLVGVGQMAHRPVLGGVLRAEGEGLNFLVTGLDLHLGEVHTAAIDSGGGAGFEPAQGKAQCSQIVCQTYRCVHTVGTGGDDRFTRNDGGIQIGAGGDDDGLCIIVGTQQSLYAGDAGLVRADPDDLSLLQLQIVRQLQHMLHVVLVGAAVSLSPEGMDSWTLAQIQHPVLDTAVVGGNAHLTAQRVQLPDKVALAGAADGGVAGQIRHRVQIDGEKDGVTAQPCGGQCGFDARMTGTDDRNVTASCEITHGVFLFVLDRRMRKIRTFLVSPRKVPKERDLRGGFLQAAPS